MSSDRPVSPDDFHSRLGSTYASAQHDAEARPEPGHAPIVAAIAARLIPGDEHWPSAAGVNAAGHIAAVLERAPELRSGVDAVIEATGAGFVDETAPSQDAVLRRIEADPAHRAAFRAVYEWVCEAYYRHPSVEVVLRDRCGFDLRRPLVGTAMAPFDDSRLDRVRALPPRYRAVPS